MANKKTRALSVEQYKKIIETIRQGFIFKDLEKEKIFRSNNRLIAVLTLQANLGLRIGDILQLRLRDIIKDGERYRLNIIEDKTEKERNFTIPIDIYNYIKIYCLENNIKATAKIFDITERAVQKQLKIVCDYLGYDEISTHSFRKYFATQIYINNDYDIELVRELLQHSNCSITQRYIGISSKKIEKALENHVQIF